MVEEPVGSVCSRSAPRSPSGGVLLGDSAATSEDKGLHRERYVATFALPGDYRVLVKRITGSVTANTVTVAMTMMKGTDQEKVLRQQVRVTEDDQILAVSLPDGRRREQLADAQLVQDVTLQRSISSLVLAQQLAAITDSTAVDSMSTSRGNTPAPAATTGPGSARTPFFGGGAVGYQPVITTLPEGTNHNVTVVVSADRRYVRVTANPFFSGIGQVTQFNYSGAGAGGSGGMGGGMGGRGGGMGGGGMGMGMCWVAREVYGESNPKWMLFRYWLRTDAPRWLHALYAARGESFAAWIHNKPAIKAVLRVMMDHVIAEAEVPCPVSE
jgi:hypothetical protein